MKKSAASGKKLFGNERGAIVALVAIFMIVFVGLIAFAIDVNHLYVVRNELQNAADAGALAGAQVLYEDPNGPLSPPEAGEVVNTGANAIARDTGRQNSSDADFVEINWTSGNSGDVQRGHWSFTNDRFTPLDDTVPVAIWGVDEADLDRMDGTYEYPSGSGIRPRNVNAVRVIARRNDIEAESFFAKIYGFLGFKMQAEAVAWIGFTGSLGPLEADMPIVICNTSLSHGDCNVGRMISSADTETSGNTAGWAEMTVYEEGQGECENGTSTNILDPLIETGCDCLEEKLDNPEAVCGVNSDTINGDSWLAAIGGQVSAVMNPMGDCYIEHTGGTQPWEMTLPVVKCDGHNVDNCVDVDGAVTVNMVLMTGPGAKPDDAPTVMTKPDAENFQDWDSSTDCEFFYQLADETAPFYNAALLPGNTYNNSAVLPDNYQSTVLKYLPGTDYTDDGAGNITLISDPWMIAGDKDNKIPDRWDGIDSNNKKYTEDMARFDCFVDNFNLRNANDTMAPLADTSMYFLPDCEYHEPKGRSNGPNFGIRAKFPVLVD